MHKLRTVDIIGAGPAGLYAAILLKRWRPEIEVQVYERNEPDATFGFGVVFSDQALDFLRADDPDTHALLTPLMQRWRSMTLNHPQGQVTLDGVGFAAIARLRLLQVLTERARSMGVVLHHQCEVCIDELQADLIIAADGANSACRTRYAAEFDPQIDHFENYFAWFGANLPFETLTQTFIDTEYGAFNAHHYRFTDSASTFIVECDQRTFANCGFATLSETQSAAMCSELFSDVLQGRALLTNKSSWRRFPRLWCRRWSYGNCVLLGDAAHTAHFSIGSGTRLAMEDAIALVKALQDSNEIETALQRYESVRKPIVEKLVTAANTSAVWYDSFVDKMQLQPLDFGFDYLMRSGRMNAERLRKIAPQFMREYDRASGRFS